MIITIVFFPLYETSCLVAVFMRVLVDDTQAAHLVHVLEAVREMSWFDAPLVEGNQKTSLFVRGQLWKSLYPQLMKTFGAPSYALKTDMIGVVCSIRRVTCRLQTQWLNDCTPLCAKKVLA